MKRFDFNLQRVLSLREYREKEWEIKLGEATGRCVSLRNEITDRTRRRESALIERHAAGATDMWFAKAAEEYMYRMQTEQDRLELELEEAEEARIKVQQKFLEASRNRKVLENLKDKRQKEYYKEQLKTESKNLDEMNTNSVVRRINQASQEPGIA